MCRTGRHKTVQDAGLFLVERGFLAARSFCEKRHQNTQRSRVAAPADLEPLKGLGARVSVRVRSEVGLVWADVQGWK